MLERCDAKVSRTVLRGEWGREAPDLPDNSIMWIKKDLKKVKKELLISKLSPNLPLIIGFLVSFLGVFYANNFDFFWVYFISSFIIKYLGQIFFNDAFSIISIFFFTTSSNYRNDICNLCKKIRPRIKEKKCECGGLYEPLETWEWVEDDK
jgi:hypothetical protein